MKTWHLTHAGIELRDGTADIHGLVGDHGEDLVAFSRAEHGAIAALLKEAGRCFGYASDIVVDQGRTNAAICADHGGILAANGITIIFGNPRRAERMLAGFLAEAGDYLSELSFSELVELVGSLAPPAVR